MQSALQKKEDGFPFRIFLVYIIFYAGQAMYNTYLNLFLQSVGLSMSNIGLLQSASTLALVLIQPLWGVLSDKSKSKNYIIGFLSLVVAIVCLSFYAFEFSLWIAVCVMLFTVFFNPAMTLQDNYSLEFLEKSKWDFGHVRLGGTLGYAICAAVVGYIIGEHYDQIFWMMAIFFVVAGIMYFSLPKVEGHRRKKEKVSYLSLLKDRPLVCMLIFNIAYYCGTAFNFQFYPLYYRNTLGAPAEFVGLLSFMSAISEVPFFIFAYKIEKKFGVEKVMLFAGLATTLRWLLLFFVTNHVAILFISMLSGCGYVGFMYCLIKYINDHVNKSMRATAQSLNAILGTIFSKIIFAPIGGILGDSIGIRPMLLISAGVTFAGVIFFKLAFKRATKYQEEHPILNNTGREQNDSNSN